MYSVQLVRNFLCLTWRGNISADFIDILHAGPSWALVVHLKIGLRSMRCLATDKNISTSHPKAYRAFIERSCDIFDAHKTSFFKFRF